MMCMSVLLPHPLGPTTVTKLPDSMSIDRSSRTSTCRPLWTNCLERCETVMPSVPTPVAMAGEADIHLHLRVLCRGSDVLVGHDLAGVVIALGIADLHRPLVGGLPIGEVLDKVG